VDHRSCPRSPPPARADRPANSSRSPGTPSRSRRARNPAAMRAARASPSRSRKCVAAETEGITCHGLRIRTAIALSPPFSHGSFLGPFQVREANTLTRAVTRAGRGRARAVYRASREGIHPGRAPKDRGGAIMPLVRSNDAPDSADPVRCAILQTDARPLPFFPPNRVSSDGSRPRGRSMDAVGALDPDPAADTASRLPLAPILAVSTADAPLSPRVTRRSGAIFGLVPSTGAPGPDAAAHPGSPGGGFGGSPYGPGGLLRRRYARDAAVHRLPVRPRADPSPPSRRFETSEMRVKSNFTNPRASNDRPPRRSASSSHHPAFSPPRTGTWVTAGSSARAEAPSSA
jgi:hypothetical protein